MLHLLLTIALLSPATAQDSPGLFRDLSLDEAINASREEGKIVMLDAVTSWCGPCRQMELTTWRDEELVPWLKERAVCIKLDMDEHSDIKKRLGIHGYPTMVVFRDGVAFEQLLGFKSADQIKAWIAGVERGSTDAARLLKRVRDFAEMKTEDVDFFERRAVAESLLSHGQKMAAAEELLWLWNNIPLHAPELASWRWDVLPSELGRLTGEFESVFARIATQRLALRPLTSSLPSITKLRDWIELNSMIDDNTATVIFCSAALEVDAGRRLVRRLSTRLFDLFFDFGDHRAAGLVLTDPVVKAKRTLACLDSPQRAPLGASAASSSSDADRPQATLSAPTRAGLRGLADAEKAGKLRRMMEADMRRTISRRYGALLAAGRDREATRIAEALLSHLDDELSRIALVQGALTAGQGQEHAERHRAWLEESLR
jgi:thioredoxin 1